jgi:signal transduction histidine kinase
MNPILLNVDDNEIGRYARTRFLTRAGFSVVEAPDGPEALRIAREKKPHLVLLDINLPGMSGLEVCRHLRTSPETERIPIIFLTASRLADPDVVVGLEAGGDNYLREPIDPDVLVATVRALLRAREAEDALARSNEQLSRFAHLVSHELQEPLRMVRSYSQLLARKYRDQLEPEADEYLRYSIEGAERMDRLIQSMLLYSRLSEGTLDMRPTGLDVPIQMAIMELEVTIREHDANVHYEAMPTVEVDSMRLSQVFRNLIGNAIKYRSGATPVVRITAEERLTEVMVSVKDNGIGIDPRYKESVFGLFKRLHGRELPGTGVGLAICRQIVQQHGGEIWVDSTLGEGSDFRFTLPKGSTTTML